MVLDSSNNWAIASDPYSRAQDVASAIKTFLGEVWYNDTLGIPYFATILGKTPPISVFQEYMVKAALTVPGVVKAKCIIQSFSVETRTVTGQVIFVDSAGNTGKIKL